ncbi:MAG TPA: SH3 domain-containing protein, partial [Archangium sp.]|uniref:SH3 domain-containing protein n=1 Tax=Archangium sp. TaxID=1872627 RepID=UPI002ED94845
MRNSILTPLVWALAGTLVACGGGEFFPHNERLIAAKDGQPGQVEALNGQQLEAGTELVALENANLRREPSTSAAVLAVVPRDATLKVL